MSNETREELIKAVSERYAKATKKEKRIILDEFTQTWKMSRKHAIKLLNGKLGLRKRKPGPKPTYQEDVTAHLAKLWEAMGRICSKKLKAAIPIWLDYYKDPAMTPQQKTKLLKMSAATIDRLLEPHRKVAQRGLSTTSPSAWVKSRIPIELLDAAVTKPGFIEADTVAHCGNSAAGEFVSSLTMTDLFSGWTENRATWTKTAERVMEQVKDIESTLPFTMLGFACDNGTEFLNETLHDYFQERGEKPVKFVRRRPYKKNDAAHVEQKNNTHVRQLFGYDRFDDPAMVAVMNEIYRAYWNPLLNYFTPTMKLKAKVRVGSKLKKTYDEPKTPFDRLMESEDVPLGLKQRLKLHRSWLNPFTLRRELERRLKEFRLLVDAATYRARFSQRGDAA